MTRLQNLSRKGFTVLELLVVIAIIAILSTVILVALNNSRGKGKDAGIKSQLAEVRNQAQLYFESLGGKYCVESGVTPGECYYGELNGSDAYCSQEKSVFGTDNIPNKNNVGNLIASAQVLAPQGSSPNCFMDTYGNTWAVTIRLNDVDGRWCVDSNGKAKLLEGDDQDIKDSVNAAGQKCP